MWDISTTHGALIVFAFATSITPGPNNLMIMATASVFGWRSTGAFIIGMEIGFAVMVAAVSLGLGAILEAHPVLLRALRVAGAVWLMYIAWNMARPALSAGQTLEISTRETGPTRPMTVLEAALFQWVNPKAWTMVVGAFAAFSDIAEDPFERAATMALSFLLVAPACFGPWVVAGALMGRVIAGEHWGRTATLALAGLVAATALFVLLGA